MILNKHINIIRKTHTLKLLHQTIKNYDATKW